MTLSRRALLSASLALPLAMPALRRAAADAPRDVRLDPDRLCAHLLERAGGAEPGVDDLVLLAVRFE